MARKKGKKSAKLSKPMKTAVKRIVNGAIETKVVNDYEGTTSAMTQCNSTGSTFYLSGCSIGSGLANRTGQKIVPIYLTLNYLLRFYNSKGLTTVNYLSNPTRVILFTYDNSIVNGISPSKPTVADILPVTAGGVSTDRVNRFYSQENKGVYRILYDKVHNMQLSANHYSRFQIRLSSKKLPKYIQYTGVGDTDASSGKNGIYAMFVCTYDPITGGAGGENTHIEYCYQVEMKFKDG